MREFLTEFAKRHSKVKSYGTGMTEDLLAFRLLISANLTSRDEQLVKATISELKYDLVKSKLVKVFSDDLDTHMIESKSDTIIKSEPVFHASDHRHSDEDHQYQNEFYKKEEEQYKENNEKFYTRGRIPFPKIDVTMAIITTMVNPESQVSNQLPPILIGEPKQRLKKHSPKRKIHWKEMVYQQAVPYVIV